MPARKAKTGLRATLVSQLFVCRGLQHALPAPIRQVDVSPSYGLDIHDLLLRRT